METSLWLFCHYVAFCTHLFFLFLPFFSVLPAAKKAAPVEGGDDGFCLADVCLARAEGGVCRIDLRRMDQRLAVEAHALAGRAFAFETVGVPEVADVFPAEELVG